MVVMGRRVAAAGSGPVYGGQMTAGLLRRAGGPTLSGYAPRGRRRRAQRRGCSGFTRRLPAVRPSGVCLPRWQSAAHSATPASCCSLCLFASQSGLLVLSPILVDVAREFGVSTATAGQLRSISGATGGVTALVLATAARRPGLRELLSLGAALVALGSVTQRRGAILHRAGGRAGASSAWASACSSRSASQPRANGRHRAAARTCSHGRSPACRRPGSSGCRWSARSRTTGGAPPGSRSRLWRDSSLLRS